MPGNWYYVQDYDTEDVCLMRRVVTTALALYVNTAFVFVRPVREAKAIDFQGSEVVFGL